MYVTAIQDRIGVWHHAGRACGATLGRAAGRQGARDAGGSVQWSNRGRNSAEARRGLAHGADLLRSFLEKHYTK